MCQFVNSSICHSPGEEISRILQARGWSQADLAWVLGVPPSVVCRLIANHRKISPKIAKMLDAAGLGLSATEWMQLQTRWQLAKLGLRAGQPAEGSV
jgi:HTH-type transcriptional regulator/antitoxin HigA